MWQDKLQKICHLLTFANESVILRTTFKLHVLPDDDDFVVETYVEYDKDM